MTQERIPKINKFQIGGANGHACIPIAEAFPALNFVVQDIEMGENLEVEHRKLLPEAVQSRIKYMVHDFFQEQPIKDADVYFFRCTLHNWSDEYVVKALRALIPALKPGAKVVIQDNGLANPGTIGLEDEINQRCVSQSFLSHCCPPVPLSALCVRQIC